MQKRVGNNVDSFCTPCKLMLAHTIVAMVEQTIKRVKCNTCQKEHIHREAAPGEVKKSAGKRAKKLPIVKSKTGVYKASDYERAMSGRAPDSALQYSIRELFTKNQLVSHPKFGIGLIMEEKSDQKIEVLFSEGPRILIHGRV